MDHKVAVTGYMDLCFLIFVKLCFASKSSEGQMFSAFFVFHLLDFNHLFCKEHFSDTGRLK